MTDILTINNKFTPKFAAYTSLSMKNHLKNDSNSKEVMTFNDFFKLIDSEEIINKDFSREISKNLKLAEKHTLNRKSSVNNELTKKKYNLIGKAYNLGLINEKGRLTYSKNQSTKNINNPSSSITLLK